MSNRQTPGLMVLHSHRLESLRDVLLAWLGAHPLAPMSHERVLVQSNGMAQWLKAAMAANIDAPIPGLGICAGVQTDFAARFFWQMYRVVLGQSAVPKHSPFDKPALRWRLLQLLPTLKDDADFQPLSAYLRDDPVKCWQLACELADLYDQYQVYRGDWLMDWRDGLDCLRLQPQTGEAAQPLAPGQRWQAKLWRRLTDDIGEQSHRAALHDQFIAALAGDARPQGLPERIIVWGFSTLPTHYLDALSALARHCQVVLTVLNPCQYYWADLRQAPKRSRQARKASLPQSLAEHEMNDHANPLLLAWGQQGRDYIALLEHIDQPEQYRPQVAAIGQRIDLFDEHPPQSLLSDIQYQVLTLAPLPAAADARAPLMANDHSVAFHIAHSRLREVEALKDYLLDLLDAHRHDDTPLRPQDIAVMVPDISDYGALVEAVFGQSQSGEASLPYTLLDRPVSTTEPLLAALDWLMRLPEARCTATELWDLLDVPAVRRRFALSAQDIADLREDFDVAGARWGLDAAHRETWGVPAKLGQNTWQFALDRLLLGFASGEQNALPQAFDGLLPSGRRGATEAQRLGPMAHLLNTLTTWSVQLASPRPGGQWIPLAQQLLATFFDAHEESEKLLMQRIENALASWQEEMQISQAEHHDLSLRIAREAWLARLDEASMSQRFLAGNVHVATLMPMRAIPFRVVCLLGLNDGEFPRRQAPNDFDLLHAPGLARAGDRSRRSDDRYLWLEAILSARSHLLISYVGRSARSNADKPPSLLVAQLREYLARGWQFADASLAEITTEHALQPFNPRYFQGPQASSYAALWRAANDHVAPVEQQPIALNEPLSDTLNLSELQYFFRSPARYFYRQRLGIYFADDAVISPDHEPFAVDNLTRYDSVEAILAALQNPHAEQAVATLVAERAGRGEWPLAGFANTANTELSQVAADIQAHGQNWLSQQPVPTLSVSYSQAGLSVSADINSVRENAAGERCLWLTTASKLHDDKNKIARWHKLWPMWMEQLLLTLAGHNMAMTVLSPTGIVVSPALTLEQAQRSWQAVLAAWRAGQDHALAFDLSVAAAYLTKPSKTPNKLGRLVCELAAKTAYEGGEFGPSYPPVSKQPMAAIWPNYDAFSRNGESDDYRDRLMAEMIFHIEPKRREWLEAML